MNVIEIDDDESRFEFHKAKPRKIIFCIDMSIEMCDNLDASANTGVRDSNLYTSSRIETTQRFLKRYANINEQIGNNRDQYSIITLSDTATWLYDYNSNVERFNTEVSFLDDQVINHYSKFDAGSLFSLIKQYMNNDDVFYHVIVLYGRDVMPEGNIRKMKEVRQLPNLTMDVIFMHESSSSVQRIYDFWVDLDSEIRPGWYYETGKFLGKDKLTRALCELVSHPLQRGEQHTS